MERIGKYKIDAKLGQGAMGHVYKAWHPGFNAYVALKTIQDARIEGTQLLDRFKREGQALAKLKHQHIVQIYDADEADGINFIVMEYMNGGSLDRIIESRDNCPLAKRVGFIVPVCQALSYAHRRGFLHRDIKPANIMLHRDENDEIVKLVDFGIARLVDLSQSNDFSLSQTSFLIGAPAYMAPELLSGEAQANERTDIWALGVTLYELISYRRPFQGDDFDELRQAVFAAKPRSLNAFMPECPEDLALVVQKMLEKNPSSRYQNVDELLADLDPVARRLGQEAASLKIRLARDLFEMGEFDSARCSLEEARVYDRTSTEVRELLRKVTSELRRRAALPRLQAHLKSARDFLRLEQFREARDEINAALSQDPQFEPAQRLLEELEKTAARIDLLREKLRLSRQRFSEGALTQAEQLLDEVDALDALNRDSRDLRQCISDERHRRERRKRLNELIGRARNLLAALQYEDCLTLLSQGLKEFPGDPDLRELEEMVRADRAELDRQRERNGEIDAIRALIGKEQFDIALERTVRLLHRFPNDIVLQNLQTLVSDGSEKKKKRTRLRKGVENIHTLIAQSRFDSARVLILSLLAEFPKETDLLHLQDYVDAESAAAKGRVQDEMTTLLSRFDEALLKNDLIAASAISHELESKGADRSRLQEIRSRFNKAEHEDRRKKELARTLTRLEELYQSGLFADVVSQGEHHLIKWPADERVLGLLKSAKEQLHEQSRRREIDEGTQAIQRKIAESRYGDAVSSADKLALRHPTDPLVQKVRLQALEARESHERQEMIQQKTREIRRYINKERYEEAISEGTEAVSSFGPVEEVSTLIRAAQVELNERQKRLEAEDKRLNDTRILLANGQATEALELVKDAIDTHLFKKSDPRIVKLLGEVEKAQPSSIPSHVSSNEEKTLLIPGTAVSELSKDSSDQATNVELFSGLGEQRPSQTLFEENGFQVKVTIAHKLDSLALAIHWSEASLVVRNWLERLRSNPKLLFASAGAFGSILVILLAVSVYQGARRERDRRDLAQALAIESKKQWPEALKEFRAITSRRGVASAAAEQESGKLSRLIETEEKLKQEAENAKDYGDYPAALAAFTELANLHGDLEEDAARQIEQVAPLAKPTPPQIAPPSSPQVPSAAARATTPARQAKGPACELAPSDVEARLRRAEKNRGAGNYESAEREYQDVLACQPNNEQARAGLERTRRAMQMSEN